jgi:hypothetical protein
MGISSLVKKSTAFSHIHHQRRKALALPLREIQGSKECLASKETFAEEKMLLPST